MTPEFLDGLLGGARLRDHAHVRLRADHPRQALTNDGMVLDAEDPNDGRSLSHRFFHLCDSLTSSLLFFASDPFPNVRRTIAKRDAVPFVRPQEPDGVSIHQHD